MNLKPKQKLYCIDATGIARDCFGQPFPNSAMVGALGNISGLVGLDSLLADVEKSFGKKFSTKVVNGNLEAVRRSWNEVAQA
jgi:pyruvate ferredoxin oxidoreductase gamma subunit